MAGAAVAAFAGFGVAAPAFAHPDESAADAGTPNAEAATSTVTVPLLGAPVTVDVTTDAGGGLLDVSVAPTGGEADGLAAQPVRVNHVSFVNEDGSVKLHVAAVWGGERVSARAGSLDEISGPGGWSGDVFGTGVTSEVAFTIGATAEGGPDITGVTVNSPLDHTVGDVEYGDHHGRQTAKVGIEFTEQGQTRWLSIRATAADPESEHGSASLKVSLSRAWGAQVDDDAAVGPHTWSGMLCDGTEASVNYTVTDDGEITDVVATPEASIRGHHRFVWVAFDRGEGVTLFAKATDDGLRVGAFEKIRCDAQFPTVDGEEAEHADHGRRGGPWGHGPGGWGEHGNWDPERWGEHDGDDRDHDRSWGPGSDDGHRPDGRHGRHHDATSEDASAGDDRDEQGEATHESRGDDRDENRDENQHGDRGRDRGHDWGDRDREWGGRDRGRHGGGG